LWHITNNSPYVIYLGFTPQVSASNGIRVPSWGGNVSVTVHEDGIAATHAVYGVSEAGSAQLYVVEIEET